MKKLLSVILVSFLFITSILLCSCDKDTLELKENEVISCAGLGLAIGRFFDVGENSSDSLTVISEDSTIAAIEGNYIRGKKPGTVKIKFMYQGKTGTLLYKVYPTIDYLYYEAKSDPSYEEYEMNKYYACLWFVNNVNAFKNPKSVVVSEVFKHVNSSGKVDFFMMQLSAQNGFGGYGSGFYEIHERGITEGYDPIYGRGTLYRKYLDGFSPAGSATGTAELVNNALKEHFNK